MLGFSFWISQARSTAPFIPLALGVRTSSAPIALSKRLRSMDMLSGMVSTRRYPLTAHTIARPIPVFPEVGSTRTISDPGRSFPSLSARSIIARAMRSLTDLIGLADSNLT